MNKLFEVKEQLEEVMRFVQQVYFPDVAPSAACTPSGSSTAPACSNYLAVPDLPTDAAATQFDLPGRHHPERRPRRR